MAPHGIARLWSQAAANEDIGVLAPIDTQRSLPYTGALDPYFGSEDAQQIAMSTW